MSLFPAPASPSLRGGPVLRWGVIGPGEIARDFTSTLHRNTDQRVVAVGSRSAERAAAFAASFDVSRSYGSYTELVNDPTVDIIYVAAPHTEHLPLALLAIEAGKHVLVEKPIATSAADGGRLAEAARRANVFVGEAMWTRYLPGTTVLRRLIDRGDLGDVLLATADVGWALGDTPPARLIDPALAGGTVLDAGVYGVWFAQFAVGRPSSIQALGTMTDSGVEAQAIALLKTTEGRLATITTTMAGTNTGLASVVGSKGTARYLDPFVFPARFAVHRNGEEEIWTDRSGLDGRDGLAWEAVAIAQFIGEGLTDSPSHPIDEAIAVLDTLDHIRGLIGVELHSNGSK